ncbi:hypothetical protein CHUAL_010596 [Chamberlinius hualienensis]
MPFKLLWVITAVIIQFIGANAWSRYQIAPGVYPGKTVGAVWPLPQQIAQQPTYFTLDSQLFRFVYQGVGCGIIDSALDRYKTLIFNPSRFASSIGSQMFMDQSYFASDLPSIQIVLSGSCETMPYLGMDESYTLKVGSADLPDSAQLQANSTWGILRGLETFSQLVYHDDARNFYTNSTDILDFPRFQYRGFLIDTSRHFVPLIVLKQQLDAMTYNKLNVLHWHIVDDQSFPYQSKVFPAMSDKGAYNPKTHIYTFDDITSIINYARDRGIRVIPEFDSPGHTESWGLGVPGLLAPCYYGDTPSGSYGPIDPTKNSTYEFLVEFFTEVARVFPDKYLHLGGDEVDFSCWATNPDIQKFMADMDFGTDYTRLESYYINKLLDIIDHLPDVKNYIVWQEVFDDGCDIKPETVVHVWKDNYETEMEAVTADGYKTILSSCWYLNYISYGSDWIQYYRCDPLSFTGNQSQYDLVMGGAGCMWAEYVDATNLIARIWPRASAVAERLWSDQMVKDTYAAAPRLEEHRCRMLERGINAEPFNGPNFCSSDYLVS